MEKELNYQQQILRKLLDYYSQALWTAGTIVSFFRAKMSSRMINFENKYLLGTCNEPHSSFPTGLKS